MYRRLTRATRALFEHWHKQPLAALTLLMLAITAVGGPGACLLDCWLHDLRAAQLDPQGLQHHAHDFNSDAQAEGSSSTRHEQHRGDADGYTPGALTIAVVLALGLLPTLTSTRSRAQRLRQRAYSLAIPPPQRPPCGTVSFGFAAA